MIIISKTLLAASLIIGVSSALCMSLFFWSASRGLLHRFRPSRLLAAVTMTTETSAAEAAAVDLSAAFVTAPSTEAAEKLASEMVKQKLAACVNIIPGVRSVYEWEGKIEQDYEVILMIKTRTSKVDALAEFVRGNHPYDVAEVISFPIQNGNLPYLQWMQKTLAK